MNTTQPLDYRTDQIRQILEINGSTGAKVKSLAEALQCTTAQVGTSLRKLEKLGIVKKVSHGQSGWTWANVEAWNAYTNWSN